MGCGIAMPKKRSDFSGTKTFLTLIQHLPVLGSYAHNSWNLLHNRLKPFDNGHHLDGLWARAADDENFFTDMIYR